MELYRIFHNKKIIVVIVFLIVLNGVLFCKEQWKWNSYAEFKQAKEYNMNLIQSIKQCKNKEEAMAILSEISGKTEHEQVQITQYHSQLAYIAGYSDELAQIEKNAKQLRAASIFGEGNKQYIEENITATISAYQKLKTLDLEFGNDNVMNAFLSYQTIGYINLIIMFIIVGQMINDKSRGLDKVTYAASNGRLSLAMRRSGIIICAAFVVVAINMGMILVFSTYLYGGYVEYGRYIQSIPLFCNFVYPISIWQFLLLYFVLSVMILILLSFLVWFVLIVVQNTSIAILILSILGFTEYILSRKILIQSNLKLLKYINVAEYFNISDYIYKYYNLDLWGHAVNMFSFIFAGIVIMLFLFGILSCIAFSSIRPCGNGNNIVQIYSQKINDFFRKFQEYIRNFGTECYKTLVIGKGFLIIVILVFMILETNTAKNMNYSDAEQYMNEFYKNYMGEIGDNVYEYIKSEYNAITQAKANYEKIYQLYEKGNIDKMDVFKAEFKVESYQGAEEALPLIEDNIRRLENIKSSTGICGWLINERAYNKLLGKDNMKVQLELAVISLLAIILLFSGSFPFERKSNMFFLLRSCSNGRKNLLLKKMLMTSIITIIIVTVFYGCVFLYINSQYDISGLKAPVQSITMLESLPYHINIITYLTITHIIRCLMYIIAAQFVLFLSMYLPQRTSIGILMLIFIFPILLEYFNIKIVSHISLFSIFQVDSIIINQKSIAEDIIKICILFVVAVLVTVKNGNKWCHT